MIPKPKRNKATSNVIGREPVPRTYAEIGNCSKEIAVNVRRASTITNTLVNRLSSYGSEVSREKQKLTDLQLETSASLSKLHSLVENSVGLELDAKLDLPTLSVETGSVASDVSIYTNQMKSPPECLSVLNPRLFGKL